MALPSLSPSISDRERPACWSAGYPAGLRAGVWALQNAGQIASLQRFKRHAFGIESDGHHAGWAVAILPEKKLGLQRIIAVGVIKTLAVEHDDAVRILLDGSRFTDVGKLGNRWISLLALAGELGESDDRALQVACEVLEALGNVGHLLSTVFTGRTIRDFDQLQVVHDQEINPPLHLVAAGLAPEIGHPRVRVIVDCNRILLDAVEDFAEFAEFHIRQFSPLELPCLDAEIAGDEAIHQLLPGHLE